MLLKRSINAAITASILKTLGADTSGLKEVFGKATAAVTGLVTGLADDTLVKNALAEFTLEHTEIASYISLIAAAEHLNLPEAVEQFRSILRDEEAMAEWLRRQIASVTLQHLAQEQATAAV